MPTLFCGSMPKQENTLRICLEDYGVVPTDHNFIVEGEEGLVEDRCVNLK